MVEIDWAEVILRSYCENERLRDAAPDLLEALREMLAEHDDYFGATRPSDAARAARAAIAKATGQ